MTIPRLFRTSLAPVLALMLVAGGAMNAAAHAQKQHMSPEAGSSVAGSPKSIAMGFSAPMRITTFTLKDGAGRDFKVERTDRMAPVTAFEAMPETLPPGTYTVQWRGMAADGHAMDGGWSFTVR